MWMHGQCRCPENLQKWCWVCESLLTTALAQAPPSIILSVTGLGLGLLKVLNALFQTSIHLAFSLISHLNPLWDALTPQLATCVTLLASVRILLAFSAALAQVLWRFSLAMWSSLLWSPRLEATSCFGSTPSMGLVMFSRASVVLPPTNPPTSKTLGAWMSLTPESTQISQQCSNVAELMFVNKSNEMAMVATGYDPIHP